MNSLDRPPRLDQDIDAVLEEAGADWRGRQAFEPVQVSGAFRRRGAFGGLAAAALGALAVSGLLVGLAGSFGELPPTTVESAGPTVMSTEVPPTSTPAAVASLSPQALEAAQLVVIEAVHADPVNFGDVYIDDSGALVIQYYGANEGKEAIDAVIQSGLPVRWEKVARSLDELLRIKDEIVANWPNGVSAICIDSMQNQVVVEVFRTELIGDIAEVLGATYGDAVRVEQGGIPVIETPIRPMPSPVK
jgi:hypothetical protein